MTDLNKEIDILKRTIEREKMARTHAEEVLESRSSELYKAKVELEIQYNRLKKSKLEHELLHDIMTYTLTNHSFKDVMDYFIAQVCEMSNWSIGHIFVPSHENPNKLESLSVWHAGGEDNFCEFIKVSKESIFEKGEGLPGRVLESGSACWIENLEQDQNFPRAKSLQNCEVRSAFAVPIKIEGEIVAIAEFFTPWETKRDDHMLKIVEMAALQLGQSLEKQQSEENILKNNETLQHTLDHLKQAQAQLVQSEKMAGLGVLAAGVAHEINNPVGFVMSNLCTLSSYINLFKNLTSKQESLITLLKTNGSQLSAQGYQNEIDMLKKKEDLDFVLGDVDMLLKESTEGIERVRDIVQGLKSFARLDEADFKDADINEGIESTLKIVWNEIKYKCSLEKKLTPLPLIRCFPGQLNQVFMNLIVNAAQAIETKGTITIETISEDSLVKVKISDTGHGISNDNIDKIFTPFFTTKQIGKGTGLGLSISYNIIEKHGGTIKVESEIGKGTTFIVSLPKEGVQHVAA